MRWQGSGSRRVSGQLSAEEEIYENSDIMIPNLCKAQINSAPGSTAPIFGKQRRSPSCCSGCTYSHQDLHRTWSYLQHKTFSKILLLSGHYQPTDGLFPLDFELLLLSPRLMKQEVSWVMTPVLSSFSCCKRPARSLCMHSPALSVTLVNFSWGLFFLQNYFAQPLHKRRISPQA